MPFGSKYHGEAYSATKHMMHDRQREAKYSADPPDDAKKAMKYVKDYDQVKNMVMEGEGQAMHNVSQAVSNLKKPMPKGGGYKRK